MLVLKGEMWKKKKLKAFSAPWAQLEGELWLVFTGRPCENWQDVTAKDRRGRRRDSVLDFVHALLITIVIFALRSDFEKPSA